MKIFCAGYLFNELIIGFASNYWQTSIGRLYDNNTFLELENLDNLIKLLPLIFTFLGAFSSFLIYNTLNTYFTTLFLKIKLNKTFRILYTFLNKKWFFDKIYNEWINQNILNFGYKQTYQKVDRGIIEFLGPEGLYRLLYNITTRMNRLPFTFLFHYLLIISLSFLIIFSISYILLNNYSLIFVEPIAINIIALGAFILFSIN